MVCAATCPLGAGNNMTNREASLRLSLDTGDRAAMNSSRDNDGEFIRVDVTDGRSDFRQRNAPVF